MREAYVLSHCDIQPDGTSGRFGSVGPLSADTGGSGGSAIMEGRLCTYKRERLV
jgi:hypothetical protein